MKSRPFLALCCALVVAWGCGADDPEPSGPSLGEGDTLASLRSGGFDRSYLLHLPPDQDPARPAPLVILFHGFGGSGVGVKSLTGLDEHTDPRGWVAVFPDGVHGSWAAGCNCTTADTAGVNDIAFIGDLIADLAGQMAIDESRIYVGGFSQGALMAHHAACELAGRITATASVGATMLPEVADRCDPARPMPLVFVQGTADPSFPFAGVDGLLLSFEATVDRWLALNGCDPDALELASVPDTVDDGTRVTIERYPACEGGAEVLSYIIQKGGHTWPSAAVEFPDRFGPTNHDMSASEAIVEFFASQALP